MCAYLVPPQLEVAICDLKGSNSQKQFNTLLIYIFLDKNKRGWKEGLDVMNTWVYKYHFVDNLRTSYTNSTYQKVNFAFRNGCKVFTY